MTSEPYPSRLCEQLQSLLYGLNELRSRLQPTLPENASSLPSVGPDAGRLTEGSAKHPLPDKAAIQRQVTQLQQQFQQILVMIANADLDPAIEQRLRPHQTEAHRRSRLLGIEAMRLQAAKQTATIERQRSQVEAHANQLQKFVQAIADEVC